MREARERGLFVRALVRNVNDAQVQRWAHETALLGDDESEKLALLGAHAVISCLGVRSAASAHSDVDAATNMRIFDRCLASASTVKFVVFVSMCLPALLRRSVPLVDARERVVDALAQQRELPFAVVRPSLLLDDLVDVYRDIELGVAPSIGPAAARCNPIAAADVALVILHVLDNSRYYARKELHIGGPDVYCWAALADLVADIAGRTRVGSADKPGVVQGMVRTLSLPFSSQRDTVSLMLRSKLRTANLDCIGAPVGLQTVRQFFIDKHIGQLLVDEDGAIDAAAPTDMPRITGCSLLWNGDRAVACATVRLTTLTPVSPRVLSRLHTIKAVDGAIATAVTTATAATTSALTAVSSPARIPDEDANANGCFRFSLRVGRACRLRWQFIVDGRGAKRAVFRVLQHQPVSSLSAPASRAPSRGATTAATSEATTPRTSVVAAAEPEIRHSTSEMEDAVRQQQTSPTPVPGGGSHVSPLRRSDAAAFSASSDVDLHGPFPRVGSSVALGDADLLATSPSTLTSPVRRLDFDGAVEPSAANDATMFDSASAHTSFKNLRRSATADLDSLAARMRAAVPIKSRSYRLRSFDACFVGREAVDWLVEQRIVQTRETAVVLGEVLRKAGHFRTLQGAAQFGDDNLYYRFAADEPPPVVLRTGLEDDDDDDPDAANAESAADEEPLDLTTCLYRDDECLKFDLVEGECALPAEGLYSLVWTSQAGRFALGRQPPPRLMYSIALFDGASDSDAVACTSDAESGASTFRARSAFAAQQPRELSLAEGELVWASVRHGHWWRGRRASDGATGWFPAIAVERAAADAAMLLDALVRNRCDPRTEGIDLLALHSSRNALNPRDAFRFPLVGFELRDEPSSLESFEPLARELHTKPLESTAPERVDDLLCVGFRGAEPPQLRAQSALLLADSDELDLGGLVSFDSDAFTSLATIDSTQRAVLSLAQTAASDATLAVREVAFARLGSASARHSLLAEVATLRQLSGEWFAQFVGVWRSNSRTALVYAPMDGGILHSHIVRAHAAPPLTDVLPLRHCLSILLCVAKAVSYAHSFGLVLRDLQADTVLLSDDPATASSLVQARLFDVSRARRWLSNAGKAKAPPTPTAATSAAATPAAPHAPASAVRLDVLRVSPPECVAWRKPFFEPLSDVWSFGCLMLELFSWRKAFAELESEARILNALRTGQRPEIGSVLPRYRGRRLLGVLESCLRPLPEPLVMLADPDSGRITVTQLLADVEKVLVEAQS